MSGHPALTGSLYTDRALAALARLLSEIAANVEQVNPEEEDGATSSYAGETGTSEILQAGATMSVATGNQPSMARGSHGSGRRRPIRVRRADSRSSR